MNIKKLKLKTINKSIAIFVFTLLLISSAFIFSKIEQKNAIAVLKNSDNFGSVEFVTKDGYTNAALSQTKIVIVETGEVYYTDENGKTPKIIVPIIRDKRYDKILAKPWGEISVIFYKDGYLDYALFYLQVLEGNTRENVEILMFESDKVNSDQPFSIIEGPNKIWVNEMITKYKR